MFKLDWVKGCWQNTIPCVCEGVCKRYAFESVDESRSTSWMLVCIIQFIEGVNWTKRQRKDKFPLCLSWGSPLLLSLDISAPSESLDWDWTTPLASIVLICRLHIMGLLSYHNHISSKLSPIQFILSLKLKWSHHKISSITSVSSATCVGLVVKIQSCTLKIVPLPLLCMHTI